jgi:UPF0176 protein
VQSVAVTTFYCFTTLSSERVAELKAELESRASALEIWGLVVLGNEGLNATVAGGVEPIAQFKEFIRASVSGAEVTFKDSFCDKVPFARFKVDVRPEIVTSKQDLGNELPEQHTYLSPSEWDEMMARDDVVIVDTRNDYEVKLGRFRDAIDPKIKRFSDFTSFVADSGIPKDKKLMLYCTGGIRCEKAVVEMKRLGYENVFHLQGGILQYFAEKDQGNFEGECFVFDHRVSLDSALRPTTKYKLCPHCGDPGASTISCVECGKSAVVCEGCRQKSGGETCSKNCAYHVRRKAEKHSSPRVSHPPAYEHER